MAELFAGWSFRKDISRGVWQRQAGRGSSRRLPGMVWGYGDVGVCGADGPQGSVHLYPHITDGETEVQRQHAVQ